MSAGLRPPADISLDAFTQNLAYIQNWVRILDTVERYDTTAPAFREFELKRVGTDRLKFLSVVGDLRSEWVWDKSQGKVLMAARPAFSIRLDDLREWLRQVYRFLEYVEVTGLKPVATPAV